MDTPMIVGTIAVIVVAYVILLINIQKIAGEDKEDE